MLVTGATLSAGRKCSVATGGGAAMELAHRIELIPTGTQADYFTRACGTARFVWNWALDEWNKQTAQGGKPNAARLKKQFNAIKYSQFPWLKAMHRDSHAQPFRHLGRA